MIYVFCAAAFMADVTHQDILAFGVFYIPLVGTAVFHRNPPLAAILGFADVLMVKARADQRGRSDTSRAVGGG